MPRLDSLVTFDQQCHLPSDRDIIKTDSHCAANSMLERARAREVLLFQSLVCHLIGCGWKIFFYKGPISILILY